MSQSYYGGEENPYEAIKVIEAWGLNFSLGSVLKYINRHGKKPGEDAVKDLKKCLDYIGYEIARLEREQKPKRFYNVRTLGWEEGEVAPVTAECRNLGCTKGVYHEGVYHEVGTRGCIDEVMEA